MAAKEDELPPNLVESMENLDRSFERCQSVLKSLMKVPLLDSKNKVNMWFELAISRHPRYLKELALFILL